jgi:hypothetical protein
MEAIKIFIGETWTLEYVELKRRLNFEITNGNKTLAGEWRLGSAAIYDGCQ